MIKKYLLGSHIKISRLALVVAILFIVVVDLKFLRSAIVNLRPIADDYCNGVAANTNIFSNLNYWFNLWSGDVFQIVISYIVMAFPLLHLPLGAGSSFTLVCAFLALSAVIYSATQKSDDMQPRIAKRFARFGLILIFTISSWVTFWWLPILSTTEDQIKQNIAEQYLTSILSWQTVNSPYVIQTSISLLLTFYVFDRKSKNLSFITAALLGFLVGTSGYVVALSLAIVFLLETISKAVDLDEFRFEALKDKALFMFGLFVGIYLSSNSPGAINRKGHLLTQPELGSVFAVAIKAIKSWLDLAFSTESIYVILMGIVLSQVLKIVKAPFSKSKVSLFALRLIVLSFLMFALSKVSELFSYSVFWHTIFSSTALYFSLMLFGLTLENSLNSKIEALYKPLTLTVVGSLLFVTMYGLGQAERRMENRKIQWESGPAPSINGQPADREIPWINDCWIQLEQLKSN